MDADSKEEKYATYYGLVNGPQSISTAKNPEVSNDDILLLPYSSGTTGVPKGVMITSGNLKAHISQIAVDDLGYYNPPVSDTYQPVTLLLLPMYHIFATQVAMRMLRACHKFVIMPQFSADNLINALEKYEPTFTHMVPPLVSLCANDPRFTTKHLQSLKYVGVGAAPLGDTVIKKFEAKTKNTQLIEGLGMSEAPCITTIPMNIRKPGSCGILPSNTDAKIIDSSSGKTLGPGKVGELCVRGPQVMKGYLKNEEETKHTIKDGGWLHTGDLSYYDDEEYFFIVGRLKELIKVNALQVAPAELENILKKHPKIADVAVIGVPDEKKGQVPFGFVVKKKGIDEEIIEEEIHNFLKDKVAEYKYLAGGIEFMDVIPCSPAGKILRKDLLNYYTKEILSKKKA